MYILVRKLTCIFFFTAWGPNDSNFKLADDTSDRGECKNLNDYIITTLCLYQIIHQVCSPLFPQIMQLFKILFLEF